MKYFTTTSNASRRAVDCVIVGVYERNRLGHAAAQVDAASDGAITAALKRGDVSGELGRAAVLIRLGGVRANRVVVAGLGKAGELGAAEFCRAVAAAMAVIAKSKTASILNCLTLEDVANASVYYRARHAALAMHDSQYRFSEMKTGRQPAFMKLTSIGLAVQTRRDGQPAMRGAHHADAIGQGMSLAKDLGNLPANVCTPSYLARTAQRLARKHSGLQSRILNETDMKRLKMHSLLSVTAGTTEPARLIILKYKGGGSEPPVVLVGKGVTFDSGGISLKPGPGMDEMKFDMCGAAGVIGVMLAVATLKLPINVNAVVPAVENLPSGEATKPGDIVRSMSGQTIEILNTDAEGRLILCDALTYSRRFKPATVIDVATLTGACVIALGHHLTGVMSNSDELAAEIIAAGTAAADRGWHLPLGPEYAKQLESNFADMANVGGREGGAVTAGCFLGKFTDGLEWAHLDIAGTAWKSGKAKGATGRPVPMLTELLLARAGALP